jgi:hypothetical protein
MLTLQFAEVCHEIADLAHSAVELFTEYEAARDHNGAGVHRDPASVLRELGDDLQDLRAAARELRDEAERRAR